MSFVDVAGSGRRRAGGAASIRCSSRWPWSGGYVGGQGGARKGGLKCRRAGGRGAATGVAEKQAAARGGQSNCQGKAGELPKGGGRAARQEQGDGREGAGKTTSKKQNKPGKN